MQRLHEHRTEPIIVVRIAIITIERKQTSITAIVPSATTIEERIVQGRKVRVVTA